MEESFSHFIERLKEDILSLDESKIKKKDPGKLSDSDYLLEILNSIWNSMEEGSLCVPVKKEWKEVLKSKPPGLIVDKFENGEWAYFEKTHRSKTDLENLLKERIQNHVPPKID